MCALVPLAVLAVIVALAWALRPCVDPPFSERKANERQRRSQEDGPREQYHNE